MLDICRVSSKEITMGRLDEAKCAVPSGSVSLVVKEGVKVD